MKKEISTRLPGCSVCFLHFSGVGTHSNWTPSLYKYQQQGANVLIFSFINPSIMVVPESFKKLASTRGKATRGAVPESTLIIFSIGGEGYSQKFKPWKWLTSKKRAEDMAERVSLWPDLYGCDGVEVNIESGAGNEKGAQKHLLDFIKKLRELSPDIIISQPTFGFPQVPAILSVINASWKRGRRSMNLADSVGLMVYHSSDSSDWVDHYFKGSKKGFLEVDVPEPQIMVGVSGTASAEDINALARDVFDRNLLGLMVWSGSVRGGIAYGHDASQSRESQKAFVSVMKEFNEFND